MDSLHFKNNFLRPLAFQVHSDESFSGLSAVYMLVSSSANL